MAARTAELIARLVDQVSGPARGMSGALKGTASALDALKSKSAAIDRFKAASRGLDDASLRFRVAQQNVRRLSTEMAAGDGAGKKLGGALAAAKREAEAAGSAFKRQGQGLREMRAGLVEAGIPINRLAAYERTLREQTDRATAALKRQQVAAKALSAGGDTGRRLDALSRSTTAARTPVGGGGTGMGATAATSAGAGLVARYGPSTAIGGVIGLGVGATMATQSSLSLERAMFQVKKATDSSGEAAEGYKKKILDLSRETGIAKEELAQTLASAGFAGRPKDELLAFTEYSAKATKAWDTSAETTGQALAELGNIYQANQKRIEEIGDAINSVADNSASKETDLLDFLRRTGTTGSILGINAEKMLAFGASMKEIGVQSEVASTGMNALLGKIATAPDDEDWGKQLKSLGLNAKKFGKLVKTDAVGAIVQLLSKINEIKDGSTKLQKLEEVFGKEYADDIAKMSGNIAGVTKQLDFVANKANYLGSVSKGFELIKLEDFNRLDRAQRSIDALAQRLGEPLKMGAGSISETIIKMVKDLDAGDSLLQRLMSRLTGGEGVKPLELPELNGQGTAEKWAEENLPFLSGKKWNEWIDSKIGATGADTARMNRADADARKAAEERAILDRPADIETKIQRQRQAQDQSRREAAGSSGMRRSMALEQVGKSDAEVKRLEGELAKAWEAIGSLRAEQKRDRGAFGLGGAGGRDVDGIGPGRFGFGLHGTDAVASRAVPLPPPRPPEFTPVAPKGDASGLTEIDTATDVTKGKLAEVSGYTVAPKGNTAGIDAVTASAQAAAAALREVIALGGQAQTTIAKVNAAVAANVGSGARTGKVTTGISGASYDQGMG